MTDQQIKTECTRRDLNPGYVYYITSDKITYALRVTGTHWNHLDHGERWCIVKNRNLFDTREAAHAAIERALQ